MGKLNDKMTELAAKIKEKSDYPEGLKINIDKMIEIVDSKLEGFGYGGDATPDDVTIGRTFRSGDSTDLQVGTMVYSEATVEKNIVTIPAGRIQEEVTVTIPSGSVEVSKNIVTVTEGYVENQFIDIPKATRVDIDGGFNFTPGYADDDFFNSLEGSISVNKNEVTIVGGLIPTSYIEIATGSVEVSKNIVTVTEGYVENGTIEVPNGTVTVNGFTVNVTEGYVENKDIPIDIEHSSGLTVNKNVVTVGKGYIEEEASISVALGSVTLNGKNVNISEGYVENGTLTVSTGNVSLEGKIVTIKEGYVENGTIEVPSGAVQVWLGDVIVFPGYVESEVISIGYGNIEINGKNITISQGWFSDKQYEVESGEVIVDNEQNKVIVRHGYVEDNEIYITGGSQLIKVTAYNPAREGFTAPEKVVISGMGEITTDWGETFNFSDINGTYTITEYTKYKKGFKRRYKQINGNYYIGGYKKGSDENSDFNSHWYISSIENGYGYSALARFDGDEIPSGVNNWNVEVVGNLSIPTEIINTEVTTLNETITAYRATGFDENNGIWLVDEEPIEISSYATTPQTNAIYLAPGGKLLGQCIDRELIIPKNNLVRRWKSQGRHFVDAIWGTKMNPRGDISFDELGYCGNTNSPLIKTARSYLNAPNTLTLTKQITMACFVKPFSGTGMIFGFGEKPHDRPVLAIHMNGATFTINGMSYFDTGIEYGKWNFVAMTRDISEDASTYRGKFFVNGKCVREFQESHYPYAYPTLVGVMSDESVFESAGYVTGQIDEACVWHRILSDEEIADMAKGVVSFNWDIPEKPYIQEQPVLYAPLTDTSVICPSGQRVHFNDVGDLEVLDSSGFFRNQAFWNYKNVDGEMSNEHKRLAFSFRPDLLDPAAHSICLEIYFEKFENVNVWYETNILSTTGNVSSILRAVNSSDNTSSVNLAHTEGRGKSVMVPCGQWLFVAITVNNGTSRIYVNGVYKGGSTDISTTLKWGDAIYLLDGYMKLKAGIRNVRIYNRILSDEEIVKIHGN